MIIRETFWYDPDGGALQLSVAILNDDWEPACEFTLPCGPFHPVEERREQLLADTSAWMMSCGLQGELEL